MITFPAEWYRQDAILLAWPHKNTDWAPWLSAVEHVYGQIVKYISQYQRVVISCDPVVNQVQVKADLASVGANVANVDLVTVPTNDTWARDHGVITVLEDDQVTPLDFEFNAWGGKFESSLDNLINQNLVKQNRIISAKAVNLILEGGSIETDGFGTLLTTEICLLNDNRNNQLSQQALEDKLSEVLGVNRFLWLSQGHLPGDDTDAHIDTLARFCDPHTIAYVQCNDPEHALYPALSAMENELKAFKDYQGNPYQLIPLPLCQAIENAEGELLPATYANFLITNEQVLLPVYGAPQDQQAIDVLRATFEQTIAPREVVAIDCRTLIEQFGSLHCISMQLPKGVLVN
ncbi:agmatine deiminase family protein [Catenovulum sp. SM1970]|uniref:agmatine deiminase family protein n=1 Tax=Marinifaba aquimaris TaxID=2741323 RepID=UPI00157237F4|nr:agmatine deiminase family protein [Marinifaba aquimaris]NTS78818.1 agmatine deiminase family protein [Marinifaba aquimaris]